MKPGILNNLQSHQLVNANPRETNPELVFQPPYNLTTSMAVGTEIGEINYTQRCSHSITITEKLYAVLFQIAHYVTIY